MRQNRTARNYLHHRNPAVPNVKPASVDPLFPNGRPSCRHGDGRPVYLAGVCGQCYAAGRDADH